MRTKTITLYDRQYQLRRMAADIAGHIYMRMMGAIMHTAAEAAADGTNAEEPAADAQKPSDEERAKMLCTLAMMRGFNYEDSKFVHKQAMLTVDAVDLQAGPIPVMASDGRWADTTVAEDSALAHQLMLEALAFNLAGFFAERNGTPTN